MNIEALSAWILHLMLLTAPNVPWSDTFPSSAKTIAEVSMKEPIFADADGKTGAERTASLLVALGYFEGSLKPNAEGDCAEKKADGTCVKGGKPKSFCMFQIHETNFRGLGITRQQIQEDFQTCTRAAMVMIRQSFRVCARNSFDDRLAHYAAGGERCGGPRGEGLLQSRHRMWKAKKLLTSQIETQSSE